MRHGVAVVGGGIAGLSAAYALQKAGADYVLLEASERWGGVIRSESVDGYLFEAGPDAMLAQKPEGIALARELGLGERLVPTNAQQRAVYVLHRGRLHPLPDGMLLAVPTRVWPFVTSTLFSWPGKLRMGLDLLMRPRAAAPDESIAAFLGRHFGKECVQRLGEPLLAGIHAGDPERLSMRCTFPRFVDVEARHGSLVRGLRAVQPRRAPGTPAPAVFYALQGGLSELVDTLVARLPTERLRLGCAVREVAPMDGGYVVRHGAETLEARAVILAVPAPRAAGIVSALLPRTSAWLSTIPFASTATVVFAYRRTDVAHPLDGYGLVVPKTEGLRTSALSFLSTKFPGRAPAERALFRAFVGGTRDPEALELSDAALVALVTREMAPVVGLRGEPQFARVYRWPQGTPQMEVGHLERLAALQDEIAAAPGLFLAGAGLRSTGVPDMIADGRQAAEAALRV